MTGRTAFIEALVAQGVPREKANAEASRRFPHPEPTPEQQAAREARLESFEQADIRKLVIAMGGKVWSTSSVKKAKIAVGFPDLWFALPSLAVAGWWETKSAAGTVSDEQHDFLSQAHDGGVLTGAGTFTDFHAYLWAALAPDPHALRVLRDGMERAGLTLNAGLAIQHRLPAYLITPPQRLRMPHSTRGSR